MQDTQAEVNFLAKLAEKAELARNEREGRILLGEAACNACGQMHEGFCKLIGDIAFGTITEQARLV